MGRKRVTDEQLAALGAYFRSNGRPGVGHDFTAAAEAAGIDRRTAYRAWHDGINGRPPYRQMLGEHQELTRTKLATERLLAEHAAAPLLVADDAAEQAARELKIARSMSRAVLGLVESMQPLRDQVETLTKSLVADVDKLSPEERAGLLRLIVGAHRDMASTANQAIELERKAVGSPTSVTRVEVQQMLPAIADVEQVAATLVRALERNRQQPALAAMIIDGNGT